MGFAEFLSACFYQVNLPFTVLVGVMLLYWVTVILGALDLDSIEIDLDADVSGELDADEDGDGHSNSASWFFSFLRFFHVGEVPLMLLLSVMVLFLWMISMLSNFYFNNTSLLVAAVLFVPNVLVSLFLTKFVSMPVRALFKGLGKDYEVSEDLVGKICTVITSRVDGSFGQVEVPRKGAPLTLNVCTRGGEEILQGREAVVLEEDREKGIYIVTSLNLE